MVRRVGPWLLALALVSCQRAGPDRPTSEPPAPAEEEQAREGPDLEAIADEIDPGPRAALTMELPPWLAEVLGLAQLPGDPAVLLEAAQAELTRFEEMSTAGGGDAGLPGVVALARALALAERAGGNVDDASVESLLMLEKAYRMINVPVLASDDNVFGQMLAAFASVLAQEGKAQDAAELEDLAGLVRRALRGAGDLHRRTVAALLRKAPERPEIPDVLGQLAPRLLAEDEALAVGVMQRSVAMRGKATTAAQWLDLAAVCHRALDLPCGRDALAEAEAVASAADEALQEELRSGRQMAKHAHRAVDLRDAAGLEDGLDRSEALAGLQRYDEAKAVYEQLMQLHPDDSRPVVGLARMILTDGLDFVAAGQLIDRAQPRDHLDRDWYELAIGVRATTIIYHMLPQLADREPDQIFAALRPLLVQMREDIGAFEQLGAPEGRVLRFVYEVGMEAWPKAQAEDLGALRTMAHGLLARTQALYAEVPQSEHAYILVLSAAEFSDDREAALAVLDLAPPAAHAEALAVRRAQAALDLVAAWDADERVPDMLRLLDAVDGPERPRAVRQAIIDGHVLAKRLGHGDASWADLEKRYFELLSEPGGSQDARLFNNLAVTVAAQGRTEQALSLWIRAIEVAEEEAKDVPVLNARAVHLRSGLADAEGVEEARADLERLATEDGVVEVKLLARAWQVADAKGPARRKADKALAKAAAEEAATNMRPRNLPGRGGTILRGTFQVGVGYASGDGLTIQLDVMGMPWLVAPCPVAIPDPRAR